MTIPTMLARQFEGRSMPAGGILSLARRRVQGLFLLIFVLAMSGCTFLAPYDAITDGQVTELAVRTETALAQADAGILNLEESQQFLTQSIGTVRALKARAQLKPRNTQEVGILNGLEQRYAALLARGRPLRSSVATGLRATLLDLQQVQVSKKRSAAFSAGTSSKPPSQP